MSRQTELNYYRQLKQVVQLVREDVDANIVPLVKQLAPEYTADGWSDTIASAINQLLTRWLGAFARRQAETIASQFVQTAAKDNARSFAINLYGGDTQLQEYLSAASYQNAKLIQSIPAQYLEQVQNIVMTNMRNGMRPSYIEKALVKQFGIVERRAKLIAADQYGKIQGDMNRIRQVNSGIEYFTWVTSRDERVRHSHVEVAKRDVGYGPGVFRWDDLPVVDGVPTFPGQPVMCRCIARATPRSKIERYLKAKK
ncbi:head protein [Klebsiella phage MEW1]|uniref:Head morphogenesis protein n=1 Tax=Klebsiella phage MEW1 TaxID=2776813 RepID=A0A7M1IDR4_9CAUD|nr:head protein [Klebsiella phage MEW1]QOQ37715.1 head morphogenesis protein [Klebsiella phage MEW1]